MKLEQQINEITIPNNAEGFFKGKEFKWSNIPQLAVITGINGSGKTQLLASIFAVIAKQENVIESIGIDINENQVYYHKVRQEPGFSTGITSTGILDQEKSPIQDTIEKFFKILLNCDDKVGKPQVGYNIQQKTLYLDSSRGMSYNFNYPQCEQIIEYIAYLEIKKYIKKLPNQGKSLELLVKDAENVALLKDQKNLDYIAEYLQQYIVSNNPNNLRIAEIFLSYKSTKQEIEAQICRELNINNIARKDEMIEKRVSSAWGSAIPPWELINQQLEKYKSNHRVLPPENDRYELSFENGIKYDNLSTGEQIIFYLICLAYEEKGNIRNKIELLLIDELDAYLNPKMSEMFVKIVKDILVEKFKMQVIMTTHSPSTAAYTPDTNLFWMENGRILSQNEKDKMAIIHELASGLTPREDTCPFMSYLIDPTKPYYILVEGYTDRLHITEACKKLGGAYKTIILDKCNFIQLGGTKSSAAEIFIQNFVHGKNSDNISSRRTITILDNDQSGNNIFKIFTQKTNIDKTNDCLKQINKENVGIILKSENETDYNTQIKFGYIPIELLYSKATIDLFTQAEQKELLIYKFVGLNEDFNSNILSQFYYKHGDITDFKSCLIITTKDAHSIKSKFVEFIQRLNKEHFEGFIPTLNIVLKVINSWEMVE